MRRFAAWLFLLLTPAACHSWQLANGPIPKTVAAHPGARYRVTLIWGNSVELVQVSVARDSLIGRARHDAVPGMERLAIPLADVAQVEVRRTDIGATVLLAVGVPVLAAVVAAIFLSETDCVGGSWGCPP